MTATSLSFHKSAIYYLLAPSERLGARVTRVIQRIAQMCHNVILHRVQKRKKEKRKKKKRHKEMNKEAANCAADVFT